MRLQLGFSGGAELLVGGVREHSVTLPDRPEKEQPWTLQSLLPWVRDHLLQERPELFLQGESVRPGILVLVNDADWELLGRLSYELQEGDHVIFISTLHGG